MVVGLVGVVVSLAMCGDQFGWGLGSVVNLAGCGGRSGWVWWSVWPNMVSSSLQCI